MKLASAHMYNQHNADILGSSAKDFQLMIQVSYLHCNQRLFLLLNLLQLRRVLSNREIPFQALTTNLKTTNKENYESRKWKSCHWKLVAFAKDVQTQVFHPAENWFMVPDRQSTAHRWSTCSQSYFTKSEPPSLFIKHEHNGKKWSQCLASRLRRIYRWWK